MNGYQKEAAVWLGLLGVAGIGAYWFIKKFGAEIGGVFSGNNALTKGTPYADAGVIGTLGAATNATLGGVPEAAGSGIGDWLYSFTHDLNPYESGQPDVSYKTLFPDGAYHYVSSYGVDSNNRFSYGGVTFVLGDDGRGNKVATALTTIYGASGGW